MSERPIGRHEENVRRFFAGVVINEFTCLVAEKLIEDARRKDESEAVLWMRTRRVNQR